jgi:glutathione S-transferase
MYTLYYYPSNANLAPHMLLEELGVPYRLELVDRDKQAHKSPEYLRMNPAGLIPVLIDGEMTLPEAAAICLHLVDKHADKGLAPPMGTAARSEFYRWLVYLTNTLQAELITYFYPERLANGEPGAAMVKQRAEQRIGAMLDILEAQMQKSGGPWLLGARFSAVDPYLFMLCRWTRGMANPARNRPLLKGFVERMMARPAIQAAHDQEGLKPPYY